MKGVQPYEEDALRLGGGTVGKRVGCEIVTLVNSPVRWVEYRAFCGRFSDSILAIM